MGRSFEDEDHTSFLHLEGQDVVISRAALQLHAAGVVDAHREGHPGFVSDNYLGAIEAETTATALELCAVGLWERVEGGYLVHDDEAVRVVEETNRRMDQEGEDADDL